LTGDGITCPTRDVPSKARLRAHREVGIEIRDLSWTSPTSIDSHYHNIYEIQIIVGADDCPVIARNRREERKVDGHFKPLITYITTDLLEAHVEDFEPIKSD
jgi:hypothetical protein